MKSDSQADKQNRVEKAAALLALAKAAEPAQGECLSDEQLAALVEGRLDNDQQLELRKHLSDCGKCYKEWLQMTRLPENSPARGRIHWLKHIKNYSYIGSALAVAASVVVYLNVNDVSRQAGNVQSPDTGRPERINETVSPQVQPATKDMMVLGDEKVEGRVGADFPAATVQADAVKESGSLGQSAGASGMAVKKMEMSAPAMIKVQKSAELQNPAKKKQVDKERVAEEQTIRQKATVTDLKREMGQKEHFLPIAPSINSAGGEKLQEEKSARGKDTASRAVAPQEHRAASIRLEPARMAEAPGPAFQPSPAPQESDTHTESARWLRQVQEACLADRLEMVFWSDIHGQGKTLMVNSSIPPDAPERKTIETVLQLLRGMADSDQVPNQCRLIVDELAKYEWSR